MRRMSFCRSYEEKSPTVTKCSLRPDATASAVREARAQLTRAGGRTYCCAGARSEQTWALRSRRFGKSKKPPLSRFSSTSNHSNFEMEARPITRLETPARLPHPCEERPPQPRTYLLYTNHPFQMTPYRSWRSGCGKIETFSTRHGRQAGRVSGFKRALGPAIVGTRRKRSV